MGQGYVGIFARAISRVKRMLHRERLLSPRESYRVVELSEAIVEYARMIRAYSDSHAPTVIVEIPELATRFRETPQTIEDALRLLSEAGRAYSDDLYGYWKINLAKGADAGAA
jgi:hypothetical protein